MTPDEFTDAYTRLCARFSRRPEDIQAGEWFRIFSCISLDEFDQGVASLDEFPWRPHTLMDVIRRLPSERVDTPSCKHCISGRVFFDAQIDGMVYERYAACDCSSGDRISAQIIQHRSRRHMSQDERTTRYSWMFRREGGLSTARCGIGWRIPTEPSGGATNPPKGIDRGLNREQVEWYGRIKGVGYENAHNTLSGIYKRMYGSDMTPEEEMLDGLLSQRGEGE